MVRRYNYKYRNPFNLDDMDREKDSIHSVPFWIGLLAIAGLWGIFGIAYLVDGILPAALSVADEVNYPDSFITERAAKDLKYLTDLGPKVTGSYENEYVVVEFLSRRVSGIISEAHPNQYIEFDVQTATGGYFLTSNPGYMNVYDRVQNVVVKVHGRNNASGHSILLNCHFDSVPISPVSSLTDNGILQIISMTTIVGTIATLSIIWGIKLFWFEQTGPKGGSDDGINMVNMLEIIQKLSQFEEKQEHNVIFLFNGAEETPLQGSHGFIAHHKWANEAKILINLEASGAGGKLALFQAGPQTPWLLKYYSGVPYPHGGVSAEEMFQSGLIPSDTDFRIFRDFGNMVGVDMAYHQDGYRYHTKYDGLSNIPSGSYQHGGGNTLSLVRSLANAPEVLEKDRSTGTTVYFDVFGLFLIYYSNETAWIINWVTVAISFGVFIISIVSFRAGMTKSVWKYFLITLLAILFSWVLAVLFIIGLTFLLDVLNKTMSWYASPWFVFGLYVVPILALSGCLMFATNHRNLSLGVRAQFQAHLLRILWTVFLILGTTFNIRSIYLLNIPILFTSAGFVIIHLFALQHTVRAWQVIYVISLVIPTLLLFTQAWSGLDTFIPISGRLGSETNPELYIAVISVLFFFLALTPLTVLSNLLRRGIWYYLTLLATFLVFFGILFTPLGFPYSGNEESPKPQRHWIMHIQRQFFNESSSLTRADSGIIMLNLDRNSPNAVKPYVKELSRVASIEEDCQQYTLCGLPLIHAKVIQHIEQSTWIPTGVPVFPANETLNLRLISKEQLSPTEIKYTVQVSGPDKLIFYITPKPTTTLVSTSLVDVVQSSSYSFQERPIFLILYQLGKGDGTPLIFDFTIETTAAHEGPTVDLAVSARYVHESRVEKTAEYLEFLNQFPSWAHVIPWVGAYQSYVL